ncbi:MAG: hypothetical protein IPM07_23825 [Anaerolineales bacterium]|nr:hypothetical protein [Anaerolineales bacterium]
MATRALHLTFVLLRRVIWTGALMAALYFAVLLAVDAIPGVEVDPAHYFVGRIVLQKRAAGLKRSPSASGAIRPCCAGAPSRPSPS